jgi:hypothetical protein
VQRVVVALMFGLRVACDQGGVHRVLMIIIVRERSVHLGRCQVGILLDDLRRTVAMRHVIGDDVITRWRVASIQGTPRLFRVMWG